MKLNESSQEYLYFIFRVLVGFLFFIHGGQKLFGWFGGGGISGTSGFFSSIGIPAPGFFVWVVALVEFFGGLFILLGLFTSLAALLGAINMLVAYFFVHAKSGGILPYMQRASGEVAALFFIAFLVLIAYGAGRWALEKTIFKKEFLH